MMTNNEEHEFVDTTPICWACGQVEEWTGEYREVALEGGELIVDEPIYTCSNPECNDLEDEEK